MTRPPSPLCDAQPDHWLAEYTSELINLLNVLGHLVELEPVQAELLQRVCSGKILDVALLRDGGAFALGDYPTKPTDIRRTGVVSSAQANLPWADAPAAASHAAKKRRTSKRR